MRALLSILCLFSVSSLDVPGDYAEKRNEKVAEYRAVLAEIAPSETSEDAEGLPEALQRAIEGWTGDSRA